MTQLRLTMNPATGEGDLARASDGSLLVDDGLETVVTLSLFTDAPATADDGIEKVEDRRGWWFDAFDADDPSPTGSRLWLLQRALLTAESMKACASEAKRALEWMVAAGAASAVDAVVARVDNQDDAARMVVTITGPSGDVIFQNEWGLLFGV